MLYANYDFTLVAVLVAVAFSAMTERFAFERWPRLCRKRVDGRSGNGVDDCNRRCSDGVIVKWFRACADIDDQIRSQQLLEEQIRQHTAVLMEANTLLQSEMRDLTGPSFPSSRTPQPASCFPG
jgi:hypothetical protein